MTADFATWMAAVQTRVEHALAARLPPAEREPRRLHAAMRYASLGGGKRVRPLLVWAAGSLTGATDAALDAPACAVEAIHVYSLVHDDLPCMDNDTLRRGRPTCHVAFDEATALLAGDTLQALAFQWIADGDAEPNVRLSMLQHLAHAVGPAGMAGGQALDLAATGQPLSLPELEFMHALKTGALIRAAVLLGAACGRPLDEAEQSCLDHFAKRAGLLFQVVDDILDCTANTATLGKTAGKDAAAAKPTYVTELGIDAARGLAVELQADATASLSCFGDAAGRLNSLCHFIAHRSF